MTRFPLFTLIGALLLSGCINVNLFSGTQTLQERTLSGKGEQKILLIDISGTLSNSESDGLFDSQSLPARLKEELTKAEKDDHIKALILRVNTPGGTVTSSDILFHEIQQFREDQHIPVITSIMDIGASGGYYLAMASDYIMAHPSSITGSIGVIMLTLNAEGLLEKVGVTPTAIMSGPKKAMGSPFRAMQDDEREIFQRVIDSLFEQFVSVIKQGRPQLTEDQIRTLADGRIYTAKEAQSHGLIDAIGYLDEAIDQAKTLAKLKQAKVITYSRDGGEAPKNIYSQFSRPQVGPLGFPQINSRTFLEAVGGGTPTFMYMWIP